MSQENIYFDAIDDGMLTANQNARKTFKFFWRELSWEYRRIIPGLDVSAVKIAFKNQDCQDGEPESEHMWISEIEFDGDTVYGTLINEPHWVKSLSVGSPASVNLEDIDDWMYAIDGKAYGAYTVNRMRAKMSQSKREEHDAAWGLDFGDPQIVKIVPEYKKSPGGPIERIYGGSSDLPLLEELALREHPMSENMADRIEEALSQEPSLATTVDDRGWSLLQRESLAGNLTPVRILLKYGADPTFRTPNGHTAIDLAGKMGWPRIIEVLENA